MIETGISKYNYMTSSKKNLLNILFIVTAVEIILGILILVIIRITLFPFKNFMKQLKRQEMVISVLLLKLMEEMKFQV